MIESQDRRIAVMSLVERLARKLNQPVDILPLAVFRVAFGVLMCGSSLRFVLNGWIEAVYLAPEFHFFYLGFEWVKPLSAEVMSALYATLIVLSCFIALGFLYRPSIVLFFLLFTYIELIDQATYLNHYYFISLVSFLLIFLPANRYLSLDVHLRPRLKTRFVPAWCIFILQLQLAIVYFFAGLAKLNEDWLLRGLPMSIWLKGNTGFPLIGSLFDYHWVALLFSWAGAFYDLTIVYWLSWRRTRLTAYVNVIVFHLMTALLFPIGMFPYIMIAAALIFFSGSELRSVLRRLRINLPDLPRLTYSRPTRLTKRVKAILLLFFILQFALPLRHVLYPGDTNWTMEGYRFAWRVMLNEKAGFVTFYVADETLDRTQVVIPSQRLTEHQQRHMSYQPDMILQFAHYLAAQHPYAGEHDIAVYAEAWVTHNGRPSELLIDPTQNLLEVPRDIWTADWILRY